MFYEKIFRELNDHNSKYVIVGGLAAVIHGSPRFTHDIDLVLKMTNKNIRRVMEVLDALDYQPKASVEIMDFVAPEKREKWLQEKNMKAFNLGAKEASQPDVDILIDGPEYEELEVVTYDSEKIELPVASIDNLIEMKKKSNRNVDQLDIKYLKELKKEKNNG